MMIGGYLIMSENTIQHFSSEKALATVIESTKKHQKKYDLTLIKAFDQTLLKNYKYAQAWADKKYYTWEQYKDFFYGFIVGKYPYLPEAVVCYLTSFYSGSKYSKALDLQVLKTIKEQLEILAECELKKKQELEYIKQETEKIRLILSYQDLTPAFDYIEPFLKLEEAGVLGKTETRGKTALLIEMFNYGFILGKRTERARKHIKGS